MKDQLIFDVTDVDTIADSDSVGAYVRSSDGTLITHSTVGGKEALDVSVADGINVEVDLSHLDDSVRLGDGTDFFTSTSENGDISLDVHISNTSIEVTGTDFDIRDLTFATDSVDVSGSTLGANDGVDIGDVTVNNAGGAAAVNIQDGGNSITVDAVDLDIRDLAFATDSVTAHQGGTWVIDSITNDVNVTATDLDIRDLSAAQDSVESWTMDGTGTAITSTAGALDVYITGSDPLTINDAALADTAIANAANTLDVANTAEDVVAAPLANRKYLWVYNKGNKKVYVGASGVSETTGFPISPGAYMEMRAGASIDIEWVSKDTNQEIRTLELS